MTAFDEVAADAAATAAIDSGWFFTFRERMDGFRLLSRTHEPDDELILPPDSSET